MFLASCVWVTARAWLGEKTQMVPNGAFWACRIVLWSPVSVTPLSFLSVELWFHHSNVSRYRRECGSVRGDQDRNAWITFTLITTFWNSPWSELAWLVSNLRMWFPTPFYFLFSYTKMLCLKNTDLSFNRCLSLSSCCFHADAFMSFDSRRDDHRFLGRGR